MKALVTGAEGQLGAEVVKILRQRGVQVSGVDRADFDLLNAEAVRAYVEELKPGVIIHCAAYTAVDRAETEPETCCAVNGMGTMNITRAAVAVGAKLLYVSTGFVFSGEGDAPAEINDPTAPQNVYGLSKLQGEQAVRSLMTQYFIVRTSTMFSARGNNVLKTMLRIGKEKRSMDVPCDRRR